LSEPFDTMLRNFIMSKSAMANKSKHWDVFPEDYENLISKHKAWPNFLRNAISVGFNDELLVNTASNHVAQSNWSARLNSDLPDLISVNITDATKVEQVRKMTNILLRLCGRNFLERNVGSNSGSPACVEVHLQNEPNKSSSSIQTNSHDLSLIYYAWQIQRLVKTCFPAKRPPLTFLEIGGGYGGLTTKIKNCFPNSRCILVDLPEVNAVSTYYLKQEFAEGRFLFHEHMQNEGAKVLNSNFDFAILPGEFVNQIPDGFVDVAINTRSFMEMNNEIIDFYIKNVERVSHRDSLFFCFNRYIKKVGNSHTIFKNYPFDDYWQILLSQSGIFQNHIHELILQRSDEKNQCPVSEAFRSLPPF
jgi:putative sugar O-methyltransferase